MELLRKPGGRKRTYPSLREGLKDRFEMDKTFQQVFDVLRASRETTPGCDTTYADSRIGIVDARVAWLLLVLGELEECIAGMEELPTAELGALVSNAILSCGFESPGETRYAISAVLRAIETPASPGWS